MPFYRRRSGFRRRGGFRRPRAGYRRYRVYRRKFSRVGLARKQGTGRLRHYFKRSFTGTVNLQASIDNNPYLTGSQFTFQQLPNNSEFSSMFDNYKIHGIKFTWFRPAIANSASEMDHFVRLHTAIDYNDASTPSSINTLMEYDNYRVVALHDQYMTNGKYSRFWRPKIAKEIYRSTTTTAYEAQRPGFIDCNYLDVPHYGIKWALEVQDGQAPSPTQPADITFQYTITYYFSCGNTR